MRKTYFLAKLPAFWRHIDLIRDAFPAAVFVHTVRDGRRLCHEYACKVPRQRP